MNVTMSVAEASRRIGKSPEFVRAVIASGLIPKCGTFQKEGSTKTQYFIHRAEFEKFIGNENVPVDKTGTQ